MSSALICRRTAPARVDGFAVVETRSGAPLSVPGSPRPGAQASTQPLPSAAIAISAAEAKGVGRVILEALSLLRVGVTAPAVVAIPLLPRLSSPGLISPSTNVDIKHLDRVVSVAQPVPGRNVWLDVSSSVGCAGAQAVPSDIGRLPGERPVLPLVRALRGIDSRRMPLSFAGEADLDLGDRPSSGPGLSAHRAGSGGDGRAVSGVGDARARAHQGDGFVGSIRPLV